MNENIKYDCYKNCKVVNPKWFENTLPNMEFDVVDSKSNNKILTIMIDSKDIKSRLQTLLTGETNSVKFERNDKYEMENDSSVEFTRLEKDKICMAHWYKNQMTDIYLQQSDIKRIIRACH